MGLIGKHPETSSLLTLVVRWVGEGTPLALSSINQTLSCWNSTLGEEDEALHLAVPFYAQAKVKEATEDV